MRYMAEDDDDLKALRGPVGAVVIGIVTGVSIAGALCASVASWYVHRGKA